MTSDQFAYLLELKEFLDSTNYAVSFSEGIYIINPDLIQSAAFKGATKNKIEEQLQNINSDIRISLEAQRDTKQAEFDNITITMPTSE